MVDVIGLEVQDRLSDTILGGLRSSFAGWKTKVTISRLFGVDASHRAGFARNHIFRGRERKHNILARTAAPDIRFKACVTGKSGLVVRSGTAVPWSFSYLAIKFYRCLFFSLSPRNNGQNVFQTRYPQIFSLCFSSSFVFPLHCVNCLSLCF